MPRSYDAFTLYIFNEDLAKLQSLSSGASVVEGSLYGLWTSTLNPVVHVVYNRRDTAAHSSESAVRDALAERYKMSYLGEWRVVGRSSPENMISPPSHFQPGGSNEFLAVDVANGEVIPYMFERPTDRNPKRGSVEALRGDNPFSCDQVTSAIIRGHFTSNAGQWQERTVLTGSEGYDRYRSQQQRQRYGDTHPPHQRRIAAGEPAYTKSSQWYSGDGGEERLKHVFERMKRIAVGGEVHMTRDSLTQDMTLSFKCRATGKDWSIEFPARFPRLGAIVRRRPGLTIEKETTRSSTMQTAIEEIFSTVKT